MQLLQHKAFHLILSIITSSNLEYMCLLFQCSKKTTVQDQVIWWTVQSQDMEKMELQNIPFLGGREIPVSPIDIFCDLILFIFLLRLFSPFQISFYSFIKYLILCKQLLMLIVDLKFLTSHEVFALLAWHLLIYG